MGRIAHINQGGYATVDLLQATGQAKEIHLLRADVDGGRRGDRFNPILHRHILTQPFNPGLKQVGMGVNQAGKYGAALHVERIGSDVLSR